MGIDVKKINSSNRPPLTRGFSYLASLKFFNEFKSMKMKLNKNLILLIVTVAFIVQLVIITYNQITGYIEITGIVNFLSRIFIGTSFTSLFGLLIVYLDLTLINLLDKRFILPEKLLPRIPVEAIGAVVIGIIVGTAVTTLSNSLFPYEDGLTRHLINNSLIVIILNFMIILTLEAVIWFKRGRENLLTAEKLERENTQIRFETLKSQLNPHFLFNSLNVLSSLIRKDSERAQQFIDEFSSVYRYTLDVIDRPVVELSEELDFAKSFLYLQKMRFDEGVRTEINIDAQKLTYFVPPLAMQTILENSFKHNRASSDSPLLIKIFSDDNFIVITNTLQPKMKTSDSKGVGLSNLKKRYELLGFENLEFNVTDKIYSAKIPLIEPD